MSSLSRRGFLAALLGAAGGMALDPERALWVPGKKLISIPKLGPWFTYDLVERIGRSSGTGHAMLLAIRYQVDGAADFVVFSDRDRYKSDGGYRFPSRADALTWAAWPMGRISHKYGSRYPSCEPILVRPADYYPEPSQSLNSKYVITAGEKGFML